MFLSIMVHPNQALCRQDQALCDKTNKLCRFYVIDDTYVVQIPSILKLKKLLGESPLPPIDPNFKVKHRFRK